MTPLLLGLLAGTGLVLVARGLAPRPAPLAASLQRLERVGVSVADTTLGTRAASRRSGALVARVSRLAIGDIESDLTVLDRTPERHALEKLVTAAAFFCLPLVFAVVLAAGGVHPPMGLVLAASVFGPPLGFVVPDLTIRSQARARRHAFRHALSSYLDLVNVLLAGGAGVETALEAAAEAGDGWSFEAMRAALTRSRTLRTSPWECFADLGRRIGVDELGELAASVQLAGQQGARIRTSLVAKAASLRSHQMARIEADAQSATERMGLPTVLMFVGFLVLLGYPAVQMIVAGFEV
jgi:Flp pilus assembly protein TadB